MRTRGACVGFVGKAGTVGPTCTFGRPGAAGGAGSKLSGSGAGSSFCGKGIPF